MIEKLSTLLVKPRKKYYLYCDHCEQVYLDDMGMYRHTVYCPVHEVAMSWIDEKDIGKYQRGP